MTRALVVWCQDWPLAAAGVPPTVPAAAFHANRVVACTAAARAEGVRRGLRRREAQARCPELVVERHDPAREARGFEAVVAVVAGFTPAVEIVRPGVCAFGTRGPSRYFGGDGALAATVREAVGAALPGGHGCRVGVADGVFAAALAARRDLVVEAGGTAAFLAPLPVRLLEEPDLVDLLGRLGITTMGAFAALPAGDVVARFGAVGLAAHRR
ncbi:MAG TPA: DNA polymerase Y family protein, partial [Acidimicrobiales bacterium]|nr:DNA polymerase Y family protein [Acidimicrobiales bacterium]